MCVCVNKKGPETESRPVCNRTVRKHCELGLRHKESGHGGAGGGRGGARLHHAVPVPPQRACYQH